MDKFRKPMVTPPTSEPEAPAVTKKISASVLMSFTSSADGRTARR